MQTIPRASVLWVRSKHNITRTSKKEIFGDICVPLVHHAISSVIVSMISHDSKSLLMNQLQGTTCLIGYDIGCWTNVIVGNFSGSTFLKRNTSCWRCRLINIFNIIYYIHPQPYSKTLEWKEHTEPIYLQLKIVCMHAYHLDRYLQRVSPMMVVIFLFYNDCRKVCAGLDYV